MKNTKLFWILLTITFFLLIINLLFHIFYFRDFHKDIAPLSEAEREKVIDILNKSMNLDDYQIKIANVYLPNSRDLVQVELIKGALRKYYIVDLRNSRVIKR